MGELQGVGFKGVGAGTEQDAKYREPWHHRTDVIKAISDPVDDRKKRLERDKKITDYHFLCNLIRKAIYSAVFSGEMGHIASLPTPLPPPFHVILSLASAGTMSDPTTVCLPTGMRARVSNRGLMASQGLFWEQELISVQTLYWRLVTVVKNGPVCSLTLKTISLSLFLAISLSFMLMHSHRRSLGSCKVETRGCEATEASCGPVSSNFSFFYISAVLVMRLH